MKIRAQVKRFSSAVRSVKARLPVALRFDLKKEDRAYLKENRDFIGITQEELPENSGNLTIKKGKLEKIIARFSQEGEVDEEVLAREHQRLNQILADSVAKYGKDSMPVDELKKIIYQGLIQKYAKRREAEKTPESEANKGGNLNRANSNASQLSDAEIPDQPDTQANRPNPNNGERRRNEASNPTVQEAETAQIHQDFYRLFREPAGKEIITVNGEDLNLTHNPEAVHNATLDADRLLETGAPQTFFIPHAEGGGVSMEITNIGQRYHPKKEAYMPAYRFILHDGDKFHEIFAPLEERELRNLVGLLQDKKQNPETGASQSYLCNGARGSFDISLPVAFMSALETQFGDEFYIYKENHLQSENPVNAFAQSFRDAFRPKEARLNDGRKKQIADTERLLNVFKDHDDMFTQTERALLAPAAFRIMSSAHTHPEAIDEFITSALNFLKKKRPSYQQVNAIKSDLERLLGKPINA